MSEFKVFLGDSREQLKNIPDNSVDCVITSPPYYGLRDYGTGKWIGGRPDCPHRRLSKASDKTITGHAQEELKGNVGDVIYKTVCPLCGAVREDNQIGLENSPSEYISALSEVFDEVYRVLKPTGTFWLNLGDTYSSSGRGQYPDGCHNLSKKTSGMILPKDSKSLPSKNMYGLPWRIAFTLQNKGWILRQDIIWAKPNGTPESVIDRCTRSHEYIFLLSKREKYFFDYEAIMEPVADSTVERMKQNIDKQKGSFQPGNPKPMKPVRYGGKKYTENPDIFFRTKSGNAYSFREKRFKRDVWTVSVSRFRGTHFATFPPKLIEPMVLAGCPKGGTVLDPFTGSGTTGVVALLNGRNFIGCELNEEYHAMAEKRIREAYEASPSLF